MYLGDEWLKQLKRFYFDYEEFKWRNRKMQTLLKIAPVKKSEKKNTKSLCCWRCTQNKWKSVEISRVRYKNLWRWHAIWEREREEKLLLLLKSNGHYKKQKSISVVWNLPANSLHLPHPRFELILFFSLIYCIFQYLNLTAQHREDWLWWRATMIGGMVKCNLNC